MLEVSNVTTKYGAIAALRDASLSVGSGEVIGLIGPNGAGKTTLLGTLGGLLRPVSGSVHLNGDDVTGAAPEKMLRCGVALVPEHRRTFPDMTVEENLRIGGATRSARERAESLDEMRERFTVFVSKWNTPAGYLSGGEAQQLAIARALMSRPDLIMMDEPSLGLAPILVDLVFDLIDELRKQGRTILVVEQNATRMLHSADRAYVLRSGEIVAEGSGSDLLKQPDLFDTFVGGT